MQGGDYKLGMARARLRSNMREIEDCWIFGPDRFGGSTDKHRTMMVSYEVDGAHRWAYRAWVGPIPQGQQVNHHCDVPACFRPEHLYVGSQSQNTADAVRRGRYVRNRGGAKLTWEDAKSIRTSSLTQHALAAQYGVCRDTIQKIKTNKTWVA